MKHETTLARELIQKPLQKALQSDIWIQKIPGGPFNIGLPDYIFIYRGIGGALEVKKWPNKLSTNQRRHLMEIAQAWGLALMAVIKGREITLHAFRADQEIPSKQPVVEILAKSINARIVWDL